MVFAFAFAFAFTFALALVLFSRGGSAPVSGFELEGDRVDAIATPVGGARHRRHAQDEPRTAGTSLLFVAPPPLLSIAKPTAFALIGFQKLGHPVPDSNFCRELKSGALQHTQRKVPVAMAGGILDLRTAVRFLYGGSRITGRRSGLSAHSSIGTRR